MQKIIESLVHHPYFNLASTTFLLLFYLGFLYNHLISIINGVLTPVSLVFLLMETTVIMLLVLRKTPVDRTSEAAAWIFTILGTFLPLTLIPSPIAPFERLGEGLMLLGGSLAVLAYLSLNTSFGLTPALRKVRTSGLYAFVRHPMYSSYVVLYCGYMFVSYSLYNVGVFAFLIFAFFMRIHFEEKLLTKNTEYQKYRNEVRYRLIPGIY